MAAVTTAGSEQCLHQAPLFPALSIVFSRAVTGF